MNAQELLDFTSGGVTILVGTVDASGNPFGCRGVALLANESLTQLDLFLPAVSAQQAIANIATTRRVAVAASRPFDHATVQFKGWSQSVRVAGEDDRRLIESRLAAYAQTLAEIGIPKAVTARVQYWPAFAVQMSIEAIYDQTPGPRAGAPLE